MTQERLPPRRKRHGNPPVTEYNARILHLMLDGYGHTQIRRHLEGEGLYISETALWHRMRELRLVVELGPWVQEQIAAHVPGPPPPPVGWKWLQAQLEET